MWRWILVGIMSASLYAPLAEAQRERQDRWQVAAERGGDRRGADDRRRERRGEQQRESRRPDDRSRPEREMLSPDERRELNRDLQRANREIYRRDRDR